MTATDAAAPLTPTLRQRARRGRGWLIAAAIAVVTVVVLLLLASLGADSARPTLDPESSSPTGAKALLQVLRRHGVDVEEASSFAQARRAALAAESGQVTLALYDPNRLIDADRLAAESELSARTVLIAPPSGYAEQLQEAGRDVAVISSAEPLENGHILEGANAGSAIRLLGGTSTLIWYTPGAADLPAGTEPTTIADLAPGWVTPVILLAVLVTVAAALWRGRRFGPLVVEDLPVVVPAGETLEGRARLYQRSDARLHALDALRMGAVARLAGLLGLGPAARVDDVAASAAAAARRPVAEVRALLVERVPRGDGELVHLARELQEFEASVRAGVPDRPARPAS
ncbi:DUF4350 domain-containing protein [Gryllotalpicola ginsengisoli]|uniref:DUF4350 domain-containing protein n=1 Tax=Gryllotalpicola ginsengisoli TaxID=444608 RepID=UPI0003B7080E|nr:DUF4350 domain-containing protein [Gryllotalpicola ginsengisoli]